MKNRQRNKLLKQAYDYLQRYRIEAPEYPKWDRRELYRFPDDWGASVILGDGSHGLEVAVLNFFEGGSKLYWELNPSTYICTDPIGYLDENGLREVLVRIFNLAVKYYV